MTAVVNSVKSKLLANHTIKVKSDWIEECVRFFAGQSPDLDDQAMYLQAYEQFLLADVREASNPVIPAMIAQKKEPFTLNGTFVLQMEFLIDIAESPFDQWRRLHNVKLDEVVERNESKAFQTRKKRMFKLELTDGLKSVCAMEYVTIACLNTKISPGAKLQIIGPLQVVNHILLLEPKNLKILGGDVEHLTVVNAYENVLLKALGRPMTETPIRDYKDEAPNTDTQRAQNNIAPRPMINSNTNNHIPELEQNFLDGIDFDEEEDVDMEMLMKIEQEEQRARETLLEVVSNVVLDDEDDEIFAQLDLDTIENSAHQQAHETMEVHEILDEYHQPLVQMGPSSSRIPTIVIPDDSGQERGLRDLNPKKFHNPFQQAEEPLPKKVARVEPTRVPSVTDDHYQFKTQDGDNMVTVDQYLSLKTSDKMRWNYVINGQVSSVELNTIKVRENQWHLNCELTDSYSHQTLSVKIHNNVVEKLSGASGLEMQLLYREAKTRPQVKDDILKILKNLQTKLNDLECFMKLETPLHSICQLVELLDGSRLNSQTFSRKLKEEILKEVE